MSYSNCHKFAQKKKKTIVDVGENVCKNNRSEAEAELP